MRESLFHKPDGTILNRVTDLVHHKNHWDHNHVDQISPSWNNFLFGRSPDILQPVVGNLDSGNPLICVTLHWNFSQHSLVLDILQTFAEIKNEIRINIVTALARTIARNTKKKCWHKWKLLFIHSNRLGFCESDDLILYHS